MASYGDIKSLVKAQRGILMDFSGSRLTMDGNAQAAVGAINLNLAGMESALNNANGSIRATLADQEAVQAILEREEQRLNDKQIAVEAAYEGQQRMVTLSNSLSEKQKAYNYMIIVVVLLLIVYVGIKMLKSLGLIPDVILDLLLIIILSAGIIYCFYLYVDIGKRSKIDFNQITLAKPLEKSEEEKRKEQRDANKSGNLLHSSSKKSCPWGTTYNEKYSVCIPNAPDGTNKVVLANTSASPVTFSWSAPCATGKTYNSATLQCDGFTNMGVTTVQPNSAFEFNNYAAYK
jgi:hypothetical protein